MTPFATAPQVIEVSSSGSMKPFGQARALASAVELMVATGGQWRADTAGNQVLDFTAHLNGMLRRTADSWASQQGSDLRTIARKMDTGAGAGLGAVQGLVVRGPAAPPVPRTERPPEAR